LRLEDGIGNQTSSILCDGKRVIVIVDYPVQPACARDIEIHKLVHRARYKWVCFRQLQTSCGNGIAVRHSQSFHRVTMFVAWSLFCSVYIARHVCPYIAWFIVTFSCARWSCSSTGGSAGAASIWTAVVVVVAEEEAGGMAPPYVLAGSSNQKSWAACGRFVRSGGGEYWEA